MSRRTSLFMLVIFLSLFVCFNGNFSFVCAMRNAKHFPEALLSQRRIISLDGQWQIAEGMFDEIPEVFEHSIEVPSMVDMAVPAFKEVGVVSQLRQVFWYKKTFKIEGDIPQNALLKIHKAKFGKKVWLNGKLIGGHLPCFTPAYFNIAEHLKGNNAENELIIRVGATPQALPDYIPYGSDFEKQKYLPGIYDSVEIILTGTPHIVRVQTAPNIDNSSIRVQTVVKNDSSISQIVRLDYNITERSTGNSVAFSKQQIELEPNEQKTSDIAIDIKDPHLWSPEDPFLYNLSISCETDRTNTTFGLRTFSFDPETGFALLNGRTRFLKGTNICFFRFMEDPNHGMLGWDRQWVRKLHRNIKDLGWDTIRYCIGFPPEFWYEIADEEGLLIQDEYPFWYFHACPAAISSKQLANEFADWMHERVNHPCVVIWDACNESTSEKTAPAIAKVRGIDLSNRPWENSTNGPPQKGDCFEAHPYVFNNPNFRISDLATKTRYPESPHNPGTFAHPPSIIINEYPWLWIDRQGNACKLTGDVYKNLLGFDATAQHRRQLYANYLAVMTEYWRSYRQAAAVMQFCALSYSRPNGFTSDNLVDLEKLIFEPEFVKAVRRCFAPIGVMIENWQEYIAQTTNSTTREIPVIVINDLKDQWNGKVILKLLKDDDILSQQSKDCVVEGFGTSKVIFTVDNPMNFGKYRLIAELSSGLQVKTGTSIRDFEVVTQQKINSLKGIVLGKPVAASSTQSPDLKPENAIDRDMNTRWSSNFTDDEWIAVDLEDTYEINTVEINWDPAFAKCYKIQVSLDGEIWTDIFYTDHGRGSKKTIKFDTVPAKWVRMLGIKRATEWGYSIYEFKVFGEKVDFAGNTIDAFKQ